MSQPESLVFTTLRNHESIVLGGRLTLAAPGALTMEWLLYPDVLPGCPDPYKWEFGKPAEQDFAGTLGDFQVTVTAKPPAATITHTPSGKKLELTIERISREESKSSFKIKTGADARYYALGEQFASLEHSGRRIVAASADWWNKSWFDPPGWKHTYIPLPFLLTSEGYGLLVHTDAYAAFDLPEQGGGEDKTYTVEVGASGFSFTFFPAPTEKAIVQQFLRLTGTKPFVPPRWGLEPLLAQASNHRERCWDYQIQEQYIEGLNKHKIPNGLILDETWLWHRRDASSPTGHYFHPERYLEFAPDHFEDVAAGIQRTFKEMRSRTVFIIGPFVGCNSGYLPMIKEKGWLVRRASNPSLPVMGQYNHYFFDFTNPEAVAWWKEKLGEIVDLGIHGFFCDFGESDEQADSLYHTGGTGRNMGQRYNMLYKEAVSEVIKAKRGDDYYMIGRAGWTGLQEISGVLQGDPVANWEGMQLSLTGMLSNALSGQGVVAHNLGGYEGEQSGKVYLRWVAFGVFSPLFAIWTCGDSGGEPWNFPEEGVLENYRTLAQWRMRLLPYLYAGLKNYQSELVPLIRPLLLEFPGDTNAQRNNTQFMCGSEMMVAPVMNGEGIRDVYLPEGRWIEFFTDEAVQGPVSHSTNTPLDRIPAYVREGGIVPVEANAYFGEDLTGEELEIHVFGTPTGRELLLHDQGQAARITAGKQSDTETYTIEAIPRKQIAWVLHLHAAPGTVEVNGKAVTDGVSYDAASKRLTIKTDGTKGSQVTIKA